jgi:hypothetical protein
MNTPKHVIDKKNRCKRLNFLNVKWTFKDKNYKQSRHFKLLRIKNTYIRKVLMHFTNKFFI